MLTRFLENAIVETATQKKGKAAPILQPNDTFLPQPSSLSMKKKPNNTRWVVQVSQDRETVTIYQTS